MAETKAATEVKGDFEFHGSVGGPFTIKGEGFGSLLRSVQVGGQTIMATSWRDDRIKGTIPHFMPAGDVTVELTNALGKQLKAKGRLAPLMKPGELMPNLAQG